MIKFFVLWCVITVVGVGLTNITQEKRHTVRQWAWSIAKIAIPTAIILAFIAFLEGSL